MIKVNANPTFPCKVKITLPGSEAPGVLDVTYRHKGVKALSDWWKDASEKPTYQAVSGIVADISGLHDHAGSPVAYSEEILIQFLDEYHSAGGELLGAYFKELTEARAKN